jgi:hypothetical protein
MIYYKRGIYMLLATFAQIVIPVSILVVLVVIGVYILN